MIDFSLIKNIFPAIIIAVGVTCKIAIVSSIIGLIIGICSALLLNSKNFFFKIIINFYIILVRGTPMLLQIMATYFLLKNLGFKISALSSAMLSIGCNSGAYISQIVLTGIKSVDKGQFEAAKSLGFSKFDTFKIIVFPQIVRFSFPALCNEFITLIKDSSLASVIGVLELTKQGEIIISQTYDPVTIYFLIGAIYFIITSLIVLIMSYIDKKFEIN